MKLALFVEGDTETYIGALLKRWLDPKLRQPIEIGTVNFRGVGNYLREFHDRARRELNKARLCGVVGLIDYYGSSLQYPHDTVEKNYVWAKRELETRVGDPRFRQHFAVHETEAWLLSDRGIFPRDIIDHLPKTPKPEAINLHNPPSHRLKDLYWRKEGKKYKKSLDGPNLFGKLDPELAYSRCPHLKLLLDDLLGLAAEASKHV